MNPGGFCGEWLGSGEVLESTSPINGKRPPPFASAPPPISSGSSRAQEAFEKWQEVPAPQRGDLVRRLGNALREVKSELGTLVTLETGKIRAEGEGEVQEMIDICDFAVGLSRQLYGLTMMSERPMHRMYEHWHPLGVVGIITAFNFPVAVWSWNSAIAAVCGDSMVWKPSSKTPLTALACTRIAARICAECGVDPAIFSLAIGGSSDVGERLVADPRVRLISATGSCRMGRRIGEVASKRMARTLLELGGNNAIIVTPNADLKLATRGILFGAVGTAGRAAPARAASSSTNRSTAHWFNRSSRRTPRCASAIRSSPARSWARSSIRGRARRWPMPSGRPASRAAVCCMEANASIKPSSPGGATSRPASWMPGPT